MNVKNQSAPSSLRHAHQQHTQPPSNCACAPTRFAPLAIMLPIVDRFHAVKTDDQLSPLLFARLSPPHLHIIHANSAYTSEIGHPRILNAQVRGYSAPISTKLLSIVLSTPATVASINNHRSLLQLICTDAASLQLHITIPIVATASEPLLNDLHQGLITAVACLEAYLLAAWGDDSQLPEGRDLQSLQALHAHPVHAAEPIATHPAFRRMSANDMHILSARAMAAAQAATDTRQQILHNRQQRRERELKKRRQERDRIDNARKRNVHRKKQRSLFKEYKPETTDNKHVTEQSIDNTTTQPKSGLPHPRQSSTAHNPQSQESETRQQLGGSKQNIDGVSPSPHQDSANYCSKSLTQQTPREQEQQHPGNSAVPSSNAAENISTEPPAVVPKRKKRRKVLRLV